MRLQGQMLRYLISVMFQGTYDMYMWCLFTASAVEKALNIEQRWQKL